jgi:exopolysaccharide biosynthesis predicted pyruvyltransferase EpsI/glycosyltransferase involved in cell wall biosynthesis/GR25 family glycosyltransferase involved in LPS biosynthesis
MNSHGRPSRQAKQRRQKICLSMIVKDEAPVIARCLASVHALIDYWIVVDTGSTDDTKEIVRNTLRDLPGELHERPWVDFAHNRSEALRLAQSHGNYTLIIDADDILEVPPDFKMPRLSAESYFVEINNRQRRYWRPQLVSNRLAWRYEGVLHEFLSYTRGADNRRVLPGERSHKRLPGVRIHMSDEGARRQITATERYRRDATVLEGALEAETDPFLSARYRFYLAQSYLDAGEKEKALAAYRGRATLGFWDQEVFVSLYRSANLMAELGFDEAEVMATYLRAHSIRKDRAEALHGAARFCRVRRRFQQAFDLAKRALTIKRPGNGLFLEDWIYQYAILDEFAVNAYWAGRYDDCIAACTRLLRENNIPPEMRERVEQNARLAREKLSTDGGTRASTQSNGRVARGQKICLSMIVKNEAAVIGRCLASVAPLIDYWVIVDTGSEDGTQDAVKNTMRSIPGELHERQWVNFAHNRTEALELARPHGDFTLVIDADDTLIIDPGFRLPELDKDSYSLVIESPPLNYHRTQLLRNRAPWRYAGVVHEFPVCDSSDGSKGLLEGIRMRRGTDGARAKHPDVFRRDAVMLEQALAVETDPFMISRYRFYLAQSYRDCGENEKAIENYLHRAGLGFWDEEVFVSLLQVARLREQLGRPIDEILPTLETASEACPRRAEALHCASRLCRLNDRFSEGCDYASRGLKLPMPNGGLFVEPWIYEYGLLDELAVNAYWMGHYSDCLAACERLLQELKFPAEMHERIEQNARFAREKLSSDRGRTNREWQREDGNETDVSDLVDTLDRLIENRPVALLDWPLCADVGDHLIWLGEKVILKNRLRVKLLYECSLNRVDFLSLARLPPETVLLMQGGGNFGDLYRHHHRLREAVIAAHPDRRIVVMPQSVMFQSLDGLERSARAMGLHQDLHVIARDRESFGTLKDRMGLSHCYLHTDAAFALQPVVTKIVEAIRVEPKREVLYLLRRNAEARGELLTDVTGEDWCSWDDLANFVDKAPAIEVIDMARETFGGEFDEISWMRICAGIYLFSTARQIVTNRLHGHILAVLMGKQHTLYDNSYGKNSTFCRAWTGGNPLLRMTNPERAMRPMIDTTPDPKHSPSETPVPRSTSVDGKRLGIIVPYRNRAEHLAKFLPHLISYFARERPPNISEIRLIVVEQWDDLPFNRGSLLNAGFLAIENVVDYVCFHDVDYLPTSADYTYTEMPTRIIWWGMQNRPLRGNGGSLRIEEQRSGLGAVSLISNEQFRLLNGYSNRFFGWGFEDKDLATRCRIHSLNVGQKDGTFVALIHDNAGFLDDGSKSPAWLESERRYLENQQIYGSRGTGGDGLSNFSSSMGPMRKIKYSGLHESERWEVMHLDVDLRKLDGAAVRRPGSGDARNEGSTKAAAIPGTVESSSKPAPESTGGGVQHRRAASGKDEVGGEHISMKTIGLCMIVKNEAGIIRKCLAQALPLVDYVLVVDTGSEDGTQDIIRSFLVGHKLRGKVIDEPWQDFAYNRTFALERLREVEDIDYTLIIDADDVVVFDSDFDPNAFKLRMQHDLYDVHISYGSTSYTRPHICRNKLQFSYKGALHEYLEAPPGELTRTTATGFHIQIGGGGARSRNPRKYQDDAALLERALSSETDPFLISRYTFYLAQSYKDCGERDKALINYLRRAELGYWIEEIYVSLFEAGNLMAALERPFDDVIATYLRASDIVPMRAEALHAASHYCRNHGRNAEGQEYARRGIELKPPPDGLFVQSWVYDYGILDEFAINAYWAGAYGESLDASLKLLASEKLPSQMVSRIAANARFAADKSPSVKPPNLGKFGAESFIDQHKLVAQRALRSRVQGSPRVLVAILAKQKESALPLYLECIEALDYPKSSIVLYIRTNNNTDKTEQILRDWVARVGHLYAGVEFDASDVKDRVEEFGEHEWNATRFRVLGRIRNLSLRSALELNCDFYFVADVDNFVRPATLRELVALNLPIVAPLLRSIEPGKYYSNYHAEIDDSGYFRDCDQYFWILARQVRGIVEVPVVHCTYLVRADVIPRLSYEDATGRFEYVIFSDSARKAGIPQYFDNRQVYGYITFGEGDAHHIPGGIEQARTLLREAGDVTVLDIEPGTSASPMIRSRSPIGPIHLINLDRSSDRLAMFKRRNSHLKNVLRVPAVDGMLVNRQELMADGVISDDFAYGPGTLGCALSHVRLWEKAITKDVVVTIFEDDVVCSLDFESETQRITACLPTDWDIVLWGYIFNPSFVWLDYGFSKAKLEFYDRRVARDLQCFQHTRFSPTAVRLAHAFGLQAYSVSPAGARKLLDYCLPLRREFIPFPDAGVTIENEGIDSAMCGAYGSMQSFACIPPLVAHDDGQMSDRAQVDKA